MLKILPFFLENLEFVFEFYEALFKTNFKVVIEKNHKKITLNFVKISLYTYFWNFVVGTFLIFKNQI